MADFCKQCSIENFLCDHGDLAHLFDRSEAAANPTHVISVLCEGCGPTQVDWHGKCVDPNCSMKHGDPATPFLPRRMIETALAGLNVLAEYYHHRSKSMGWWLDPVRGPDGEILLNEDGTPRQLIDKTLHEDPIFDAIKTALIASEGHEAFEFGRTGKNDDKLTHYPGEAVELSDVLIRVFDKAGKKGFNLSEITMEKDAYNGIRPDHKPEDRFKKNGKAF